MGSGPWQRPRAWMPHGTAKAVTPPIAAERRTSVHPRADPHHPPRSVLLLDSVSAARDRCPRPAGGDSEEGALMRTASLDSAMLGAQSNPPPPPYQQRHHYPLRRQYSPQKRTVAAASNGRALPVRRCAASRARRNLKCQIGRPPSPLPDPASAPVDCPRI